MACSKTIETVRAPWSSKGWIAYYRTNAKNLMALPWKRGAELTAEERHAIASSLQDFQLGESSEGRHLVERARIYSANHDPDYLEGMQSFIREEQQHARDLGTFLKLADIPLLERTRLDSIFRWLRRLAAESSRVVAAWGNEGVLLGRDAQVRELLAPLHALGLTQQGQPRHPLYLRSGVSPSRWC